MTVRTVLGIDLFGVIVAKPQDRPGASFANHTFIEAPAVPGAFEGLRALRDHVANAERDRSRNDGRPLDEFPPPIYVVSSCTQDVSLRVRAWMKHQGFHDRAGIPDHHVYLGTEKWRFCEQFCVTHFVDDRPQVLSYLDSVPHRNRYLFAPLTSDAQAYRIEMRGVHQVSGWQELLQAFGIHVPA